MALAMCRRAMLWHRPPNVSAFRGGSKEPAKRRLRPSLQASASQPPRMRPIGIQIAPGAFREQSHVERHGSRSYAPRCRGVYPNLSAPSRGATESFSDRLGRPGAAVGPRGCDNQGDRMLTPMA